MDEVYLKLCLLSRSNLDAQWTTITMCQNMNRQFLLRLIYYVCAQKKHSSVAEELKYLPGLTNPFSHLKSRNRSRSASHPRSSETLVWCPSGRVRSPSLLQYQAPKMNDSYPFSDCVLYSSLLVQKFRYIKANLPVCRYPLP